MAPKARSGHEPLPHSQDSSSGSPAWDSKEGSLAPIMEHQGQPATWQLLYDQQMYILSRLHEVLGPGGAVGLEENQLQKASRVKDFEVQGLLMRHREVQQQMEKQGVDLISEKEELAEELDEPNVQLGQPHKLNTKMTSEKELRTANAQIGKLHKLTRR